MVIIEEKKITLKIELCDKDKENIRKTFHLLNTIDDIIQQQDNLKDITTDVSGQTDSKKYRGCFFFIQNERVRNAFDTYRKVENLAQEGFKTENEQIRNVDNTINISNFKKGFKLKK